MNLEADFATLGNNWTYENADFSCPWSHFWLFIALFQRTGAKLFVYERI